LDLLRAAADFQRPHAGLRVGFLHLHLSTANLWGPRREAGKRSEGCTVEGILPLSNPHALKVP
jgi:hypothetical protein